jgi:c-di-GMP-binding flagellar brake protein YcgR
MTRKRDLAPSFKPVETERETKMLGGEIRKIRPVAEITLEGLKDTAKGRIQDWQPTRKLFTIEWIKKSASFDQLTEKSPNLRAYFKTQLFTTQLVFKSSTVRRIDDEHSHFRIPEQLFHQQMRGTLRVPLISGRAILRTPKGEFTMLDLSVGGAKVILPDTANVETGVELGPCELRIGTFRIAGPTFMVKVARTAQGVAGVRFVGLEERHKTLIKQFLIDALKTYYEVL